MAHDSKPRVIVFCRHPHLGVGKRRLALDVGDGAAWRWYRNHLFTTLRALSTPSRWSLVAAIERPPARLADFGLPPEIAFLVQQRGDLGFRMISALNTYAPGPVFLVGSDILDLKPDEVAAGIKSLQSPGLVLAPAADGGFWGLGLRGQAVKPSLLSKVDWSLPNTLEQSLAAAGRHARRIERVKRDVDRACDLPSKTSTGPKK